MAADTLNQLEAFVQAARRMGGMYFQAWKDGVLQTDIENVGATVTVNRVDIPLVGRTSVGHKRGRTTREGTMGTQKIDSRWELFVWNNIQSHDVGDPTKTFDLKLALPDPDAYGKEAWQLYDCQLWSFSLGASIGDDSITREYPLTWEREEPIDAFEVRPGGIVVPTYVDGQAA